MSAFGDFDPAVKIIAFILGGGVALSSHGTKLDQRGGRTCRIASLRS